MAFWNSEDRVAQGSAPLELDAPAAGADDLLLGPGAEFEGKLTFAGTVRIDARFKGSIATQDVLVIGDRARIDAEITCGTVIVYGEVTGNIRAATAVELHHPAKVRGDVETPSLSIERGVVFEGRSSMPEAAGAEGPRLAPPRASAVGVRDPAEGPPAEA